MHFKSTLSHERRRLVELMQTINFGRIEQLNVRLCQPVFSPSPIVVREHKFSAENGPRAERHSDNFLLKRQVIELFEQLDAIADGIIDEIEVKHGLPFRMVVRELAA